MQPRDFNLLTKDPSGPVISSLIMLEPLVVGIPFTEQISFMAIGMPISGPRSTPLENNLSIPSAQDKALSSLRYIYALSFGFKMFILT